jgi:hypothetical protein
MVSATGFTFTRRYIHNHFQMLIHIEDWLMFLRSEMQSRAIAIDGESVKTAVGDSFVSSVGGKFNLKMWYPDLKFNTLHTFELTIVRIILTRVFTILFSIFLVL